MRHAVAVGFERLHRLVVAADQRDFNVLERLGGLDGIGKNPDFVVALLGDEADVRHRNQFRGAEVGFILGIDRYQVHALAAVAIRQSNVEG